MSSSCPARVAVLGYVNIDHVAALNRELEPGITAQVARWHTRPAGRLGGCASYIATGLAAAGLDVSVVSAVGSDAGAAAVADMLTQAGVNVSGVQRGGLPRTGAAWLAYSPSGRSYCVYDAGGPLPDTLSRIQQQLCSTADCLVTSVGPPSPCAAALELLRPRRSLCWPVKADPVSFPPPLAHALAQRADTIVYSAGEAGFLDDVLGSRWRDRLARPGVLVVETRAADGARFWDGGQKGEMRPTAEIAVADSTGAGDRFCAGLLAARMTGATAEKAIEAGMAAAVDLLSERAGYGNPGSEEENR